MNTATGITPNKWNYNILKNNNWLILIKIYTIIVYIYDFKYISNFVNNTLNVDFFINVIKKM